ncbi:MAG: hypothetical protein RJA99_3142 [Pseudomonadota bacterium]|jgi:hypothetical protein
MDFRPDIAHITGPTGAVYQVLNTDGDDWDEPATRAQYQSTEYSED